MRNATYFVLVSKMVLESITLKRFGKHKSRTVDFDPGVTTIVGVSSKGKTAILNALRWVAFNQPRGKSFIHKRKGICSAKLYVDGHVIKRTIGRSINSYHLESKRYVSFGAGRVPQPIENILRIGQINFQRQLDPVFMFSETPGSVSRSLNQVINLGLIDSVLASIASVVRDADKTLSLYREQLEEAREKAKSFDYVDELAADFTAILAAHEQHSKAASSNAEGARRLNRASELHSKLCPLLEAKGDGSQLLALGARLDKVRRANKRLSRAVDSAKALSNIRAFLQDAEKLSVFREKADKVAEDNRELWSRIDQASTAKEKVCQLRSIVQMEQDELKVQMAGRCPVCGKRTKRSLL